MTFGELKAELDKLTPEQLACVVMWWGEDRGGKIHELHVLPEDNWGFGDGWEPSSSYADHPEREELREEAEILPKGTPVLCTDGI